MAAKKQLKTQVGIIGAGPSGLLLARLLSKQGISSVILESRSKAGVLGQVRAGLLEQGTADLIRQAEASAGLDTYGLVHKGVILSFNGKRHRIPLTELTEGKVVTIYGQQELTRDLIGLRESDGLPLYFEALAHEISGLGTPRPIIEFIYEGKAHSLECDFIAGCDGFHGLSRKTIPAELTTVHDKKYPFCWLGILARVAPSTHELIYAYHDRGFAMHSMRSAEISRLYLQVDIGDTLENWPDTRIWEELQLRMAAEGWELKEGPIIEKSITQMRSFVVEPMQYQRLFLVGDSAHIVPPTGAKGLNSAAHDAKLLFESLMAFYTAGDSSLLESYSAQCLKRVWRTQEFSNFMTHLLHVLPDADAFDRKLQKARFDYIVSSAAQSKAIAENYVGLSASELTTRVY